MTSIGDLLLNSGNKTSFLGTLLAGTVRGDLVFPFPAQEKDDEIIGTEITAKLEALLKDKVDRTQIDTTKSLPDGLFDELRDQGFMNLRDPIDYSGLGLSNFNTFRLLKKAAEYSTTVALSMAVQTSIGIGGYLKYIPEGELRDFVLKHTKKKSISSNADAEPAGASHPKRFTTATLTEDGTAYVLNGKKVYISNASIADVLIVSARVCEQEQEITRLFFIEASSPGVEVTSKHEFMGLKGYPNASIQFNDVRVPKEQVLVEPPLQGLTLSSHLTLMLGRIYMLVAPSVAMGELCTQWMRDYLKRRSSVDLPLEKYEALQNIVALSLAEVFAMQSVAEWSVLTEDQRDDLEPKLEQVVARNICANTCWNILDRTMSLMATEGYETAQSKKARGVAAIPIECCLRDARNARTQCGSDFLLDCLFAQMIIFPIFYQGNQDLNVNPVSEGHTVLESLSDRNKAHWHFLVEESGSLANICQNLVKKYPNPGDLYPQEELMILTTQMASELMTISLVLSKAASLEATVQPNPQDLADIYCTAAKFRISDLKNKLLAEEHPNYQGVFQDWLSID